MQICLGAKMRWLLIQLGRLLFRVGGVFIPILVSGIGFILRLIMTAVVSLFIGIPIAIHRIADDETERAIKGGATHNLCPSLSFDCPCFSYCSHCYWLDRLCLQHSFHRYASLLSVHVYGGG